MSPLEWLLATIAVTAASALQTAIGAGLGLVAAPVLILILASETAIHTAIVLNLVISLLFIRSESEQVAWAVTSWLCVGTVVGVPLGVWTLRWMDLDTLQVVAGVCVLLAGAQLALIRLRHRGVQRGAWTAMSAGIAGSISGSMTGAMAIPGPAALWQLSRSGVSPSAVRASLRAQFCVAYTLSLLVHVVFGLDWTALMQTLALLSPGVLIGALLGTRIKRWLSEQALAMALLIILFAMGGSLLLSGL